ncbi:MAG: GTP cyclohydrolase I FolE2 [Treponema sp.]|nr:GTP cyclohydrolase I FolE2 [Treponema sp.]
MNNNYTNNNSELCDIQNSKDTREVPLQKVGVKGLHYPVTVLDKKNGKQQTVATVDLFVNLPKDYKGTHMSRFVEIFHKYHNDISMNHFFSMLEEIQEKLFAEEAYGIITFPFFIKKNSPVTFSEGMMSYTCSYEGRVKKNKDGNIERDFFILIDVPVATLCPCSKAISEYGAHNQRGNVKLKLYYTDFFWIEDIIWLVENCASSSLYSVLKRPDEKYVTEHAYENPRFVEDVVREVYIALQNFNIAKPFKYFSIEAKNYESIHNHNAYAFTEYHE